MVGDARNAPRALAHLSIGKTILLVALAIPKHGHRYIMSMSVADYSGQAWLQGFNEVGTTVFGMTANELLEIKVKPLPCSWDAY